VARPECPDAQILIAKWIADVTGISPQVAIVCFQRNFHNFRQRRLILQHGHRCVVKVTWEGKIPATDEPVRNLHVGSSPVPGFQFYSPYLFAIQTLMDTSGDSLIGRPFQCQIAFADLVTFEGGTSQGFDKTAKAMVPIFGTQVDTVECHAEANFFSQITEFALKLLLFYRESTDCHLGFQHDPRGGKEQPPELTGSTENWNTHDLPAYVFTATPLAYVLPLCFKQIRQKLKQNHSAVVSDVGQMQLILSCIPAAIPDIQAHSVLDCYFDYHLTLEELATLTFDEIKTRIVAAQGLHDTPHSASDGLRTNFVALLESFHTKLRNLQSSAAGIFDSRDVPDLSEACIWFENDQFATSRNKTDQRQISAWMGLGEPQGEGADEFRRPVCIRKDPFPREHPDYKNFKDVMRYLNPGVYISAAYKSNVFVVKSDEHAPNPRSAVEEQPSGTEVTPPIPASPASCSQCTQPLPGSQPSSASPLLSRTASSSPHFSRRWVYELGICTLEELFENPIQSDERRTQAFKSILREVKNRSFWCNGTCGTHC